MFGTCAGLILLANKLVGYDSAHIASLDATVERNSFGRQVDSFETKLSIKGVADRFSSCIYTCTSYCRSWSRS